MNKKQRLFLVLTVLAMLLAFGTAASAASKFTGWKKVNNSGDYSYYKKGKIVKGQSKWISGRHLNKQGNMDRNKWIVESKKTRYYVNSSGKKVTGLKKIKGYYYYFNKSGVNKTGWQTVKGEKYYFFSTNRRALTNTVYKFKNGKSYYFNEKGQMQTDWQTINGSVYYFKDYLRKGWLTLGGKKYYLIKAQNGKRAEGIFSVAGKIYYFEPETGVMQTSTTVTYKDRQYTIDSNGVCTVVPDSNAPSDKMLFFLAFESGSQAYNQTGGDNGRACGAYQFDYAYALLPFVKYAYGENPSVCAEFKPYAAYALTDNNRAKLKGNTKFYKAWNAIYKRNPKTFSTLQDTFAKINYYDNVERTLENAGIEIATRSDAVKGAIFSYSIQHGPGSLASTGSQCGAIGAVKSIKSTSSTTDAQFLKKLYNKRIKDFPAYKARYTLEYQMALNLL